MDPATNSSQDNAGASIPELEALLKSIDTLLPNSKERSVSSVELYLDGSPDERLMITGLRFPSGALGQIRFDYRGPRDSSLIDLDTEAVTMQGFDMAPQAETLTASRHMLDVPSTSVWLEGLIARGSAQKVDNR